MKKQILFVAVLGLLLIAACSKQTGQTNPNSPEVMVYKSANCGCCGLYVKYLQSKGDMNVKVVDVQDVEQIKNEYSIPPELRSCHTTVIGNYVVEGHVPLEAIEKLLTEKPDIKGIALAGMPSGSPGMPGAKNAPFTIYSVHHDGTYDVMATL